MSQYVPLPGFQPVIDSSNVDLWLIFYKNTVVNSADGLFWDNVSGFDTGGAFISGHFDDKAVGIISVESVSEHSELTEPRPLLALENPGLTALYSHAIQLVTARKNNRYCGQCGSPCLPKPNEWAMHCTACAMAYYPRISPCIIVLVHKGDEVLLVQHHRHLKDTGIYTTIAGFIEPGESAEDAVAREVMEESGIVVNNIRYCFSQSWPFPHSLMLGYHAEYVSGDITLEEKELSDGQWFHREQLPKVPPDFTIARRLIDKYINSVALAQEDRKNTAW